LIKPDLEKGDTQSITHPHCKAGWSGKLVHLPGPYGPTFWNFNLLQYEYYTRHNGPGACCSVGGRGGVAYRSRSLVYISGPCCFCYAAAHLGVLKGRLFTDKKLALCLPAPPAPWLLSRSASLSLSTSSIIFLECAHVLFLTTKRDEKPNTAFGLNPSVLLVD
jgi:hypothetical protein